MLSQLVESVGFWGVSRSLGSQSGPEGVDSVGSWGVSWILRMLSILAYPRQRALCGLFLSRNAQSLPPHQSGGRFRRILTPGRLSPRPVVPKTRSARRWNVTKVAVPFDIHVDPMRSGEIVTKEFPGVRYEIKLIHFLFEEVSNSRLLLDPQKFDMRSD